ncbi:E3 ubiquitin-protein ligase RNF128 isoform X2 [Stegostoma tigrinum]|uniref:E3 ubiquitin-protein ligase RNF128 isoform X2 n=1 Tax=Stegostoma tigrinum TaxID=3053191 RepID=UPI00202B59BF|nr:E3 ubiquitin-protein ligase RNF128 isoform X2 [Stegostoma tigrinum]
MKGSEADGPHAVWLLQLAFLCQATARVELAISTAIVNVTSFSAVANRTLTTSVDGIYGANSPVKGARGVVGVPDSHDALACDDHVDFSATESPWIALVERGNCTFAKKIENGFRRGAAAVVIFNGAGKGNRTDPFIHHGTGNMVAVMIGNIKGSEILALVKEGIAVSMVIEVGKQHGPWMSQYSIFFVSVSFFVVTAATVGYFIFYSARRLRLARAQSRKQKQLKNEAKKAINQLDLRILKHGDPETGPDADSCAVCIEAYKPNDVVRILTCNHIFHKHCIDPWLLEHRTCPMCKCDILKALGIEVDIEKAEETPAPEQSSSNPQRTGQDRHTEVPESAIYTVPAAFVAEHRLDESPVTEDNHYFSEEQHLVNNDARVNSLSVYVLPQDNPVYEEIDLQDEVKS